MSEQTVDVAAKPEAKKADKTPHHLPPLRFKQAEYERTLYRCIPEAGTPLDETLVPAYWAHVAAKLKPYDRIEVVAEDAAYWAELLVLDAGRMWAKVQIINKVVLDAGPELEADLDDGYEIKYAGPQRKHQVVRKSDAALLKEGISTKAEANQWLRNHVKSLAH